SNLASGVVQYSVEELDFGNRATNGSLVSGEPDYNDLVFSVTPLAVSGTLTPNHDTNTNPNTLTQYFDDGQGHSATRTYSNVGPVNMTYTDSSGVQTTFDSFCVDLPDTFAWNTPFTVYSRGDVASSFVNGPKIAWVMQTYGLADLSGNNNLAEAV